MSALVTRVWEVELAPTMWMGSRAAVYRDLVEIDAKQVSLQPQWKADVTRFEGNEITFSWQQERDEDDSFWHHEDFVIPGWIMYVKYVTIIKRSYKGYWDVMKNVYQYEYLTFFINAVTVRSSDRELLFVDDKRLLTGQQQALIATSYDVFGHQTLSGSLFTGGGSVA